MMGCVMIGKLPGCDCLDLKMVNVCVEVGVTTIEARAKST